jgi:uncharacterized damage-inducible protein DinB
MDDRRLETIRWQYRHLDGTWDRLLIAARGLSDADLRRPGGVAGGFADGSVFEALVHIVGAEHIWFARWTGAPDATDARPAGETL